MSLNLIKRTGLRVRSPQDLAAGLFMISLGRSALFLARDLPSGTLRQIGSGMLPKTFSIICIGLGVMLLISAMRYEGEKLGGWSWRGIIFVLGGACLFGLTIRGFEFDPNDIPYLGQMIGIDLKAIKVPPLGLAVAGPLVVLVAGLAAEDYRPKELIIFAISMTALCALLFKYALSLPIPLAPWLIGV